MIVKVAGHLLLKLNADGVRQASLCVRFGLRNIRELKGGSIEILEILEILEIFSSLLQL